MDERAKLAAALTREDLSIEERARAGDELAKLGDPRATAEDRVAIPAGHALLFEPARRVFVSAFAIDRHPVTVAAYRRMIDAGGYRDRSLWSKAGWSWRARERIVAPRFWDEPEWAPYLIDNHPVVGVSAYEAEAYARWIGARLPTEAEWEKACRGDDGRKYPWGEGWVEDACAKRGYGPRSTLPIGCFPRGRSPFGVEEMIGCVWQWCRDVVDADAPRGGRDPLLDPDEYEDDTERATRGGGWNNLEWNLHATSVNAFPPTARFSNLGFRCVVSLDKGGRAA